MIQTALVSALLVSNVAFSQAEFPTTASAQLKSEAGYAQNELSSRSMSLNMRFGYELPENAYKDNILLNLAYIDGSVKNKSDINWDNLKQPKTIEMTLSPGQIFAYHDVIDPKYNGENIKTVKTNFGAGDGYKYSDGLYGMGVCHLASLIHWAALDAGLESVAPTNHDFFAIPEVPKEYGAAIYSSPDSVVASQNQNLYIKNTFDTPVTFKFDFDGTNLKVVVIK